MTVKLKQLENGLIIATENRPDMQSVALGLWVKAGSRNERENQHGLAHLLEHMAFKGTKTRNALEIAAAIENVGGDINAATGMETTSYFIRVLRKDLPLATEILGEIITEPLFSDQELEREKQVILQEIGAADDTPDDIVFDQFTTAAYPGQAIGRPILGTEETVTSFTADNLREFMAEHYYAGNMVVVACGAVDHEDFAALIEKNLEKLPQKPINASRQEAVARYEGGDNRKSRALMDTQILLGFEACGIKDDEFYAAHILAMILGGGMSSRLFQEVREKRGLCYSIYAFYWAFADTGLFGIHTATDEAGMRSLTPVLLEELQKAAHLINPAELERARAQYAAGLIMGQENAATRASMIARQLLMNGKIKTDKEVLAKIAAISPANIEKLAQKLFFNTKPSFAAIGRVEHLMPFEKITAQIEKNKQKI